MQTKVFLQSFDTHSTQKREQIDLKQELIRMQHEQEILYKQKLETKEKELEKRITQELTEKFNTDLNNLRHEISQKSLRENKELITKIFDECNIYKQNCASIMTLFMDYFIKKIHKHTIHNDIQKLLSDTFKANPEIKLALRANSNTLQSLQDNIKIESVNIDFIPDEAMPIGDIECKYLNGGGIYICEDAIIETMNDIIMQTLSHFNL